VHVNCIAPIAGSRIMATVMPDDLMQHLLPEYVAAIVAWLCHHECPSNGAVVEAGGGWFGRLRLERSRGAFFPHAVLDTVDIADRAAAHKPAPPADTLQFVPEMVRDHWDALVDFRDAPHPVSNQEAVAEIMSLLDSPEVKALLAARVPKL
jgi:hypothetical protein